MMMPYYAESFNISTNNIVSVFCVEAAKAVPKSTTRYGIQLSQASVNDCQLQNSHPSIRHTATQHNPNPKQSLFGTALESCFLPKPFLQSTRRKFLRTKPCL